MIHARHRLAILPALILLFACAAQVAPAAAPPPPPGAAFPAWTPLTGLSAEGVAIDRLGRVFATVREGSNGVILEYDRHGNSRRVAELGPGMIGGLAFSPEGVLHAAVAAGAGQGVYRVLRHGTTEIVPGTERMAFANALAFDCRGTLYITESFSLDENGAYGPGGIWRVVPGREAQPWLRHTLLTGVGAALGYPVGANGIAIFRGDLYVANTDKGLIVRVPVNRHGRPGTPDVWAAVGEVPGSPMAGKPIPPMADGLAIDARGNVYVALVSRCAVVRIDGEDRTQETVAYFQFGPPDLPLNAPLDTPASLAFGTRIGERDQLFVTNLGMMSAMAPGPPWPGAGLVKIDVDGPDRLWPWR
jgi:sugar lactone lactonase YvrE